MVKEVNSLEERLSIYDRCSAREKPKGMTLKQAIESGKRFKRPHHQTWTMFQNDDEKADDWIIDEEKIEITKEQLRNACDDSYYLRTADVIWDRLKNK